MTISIGTMQNMGIEADGSDAMSVPTYVDCRVLGAGVAETVTIPSDASKVLFSATDNFYAAYTPDGIASNTAVVPSADVADGTSNELNPIMRRITQLDEISLISPFNCTVTMAFFKN